MTGKVWLVGAGPGDVGLLTLRGREVLESADVVVYDALVGQGVLSLIPESAKLIFAGKRAGNHYLRQEETNRVLLDEALKGNNVVRLKGGDPFLFGRGGEELELLVENNVPFEIVPGITSAIAVPAYNGIPVTHRDFCSSVHVITGHRRAEQGYDIDFEALVRTKGTLVFLMGIAALPDITAGLLAAGIDPDTPAAVLERGTTAAQHRILATVSTLEAVCAATVVQTPAIIVVGKVCALADDFAWYEKRPLAGVKVLLTRPKELVSSMAVKLRRKGAEVLELPAIRTELTKDTAALDAALERLAGGGYDWVAFTSPSGVRLFFEYMFKTGDIRAFGGVKVAAIGEGTRRELLKYGLRADFLPTVYEAETLGTELAAACAPGARILIPRAAMGNPLLVENLRKGAHFTIDEVPLYDTVFTASRVLDLKEILASGEADFAVFTSASTVRGFAAAADGADLTKVRAVCIGRQTEAEAKKRGMKTWTAEKATLDSLCDRLEQAAVECRNE